MATTSTKYSFVSTLFYGIHAGLKSAALNIDVKFQYYILMR